jgi:hypothetical protein
MVDDQDFSRGRVLDMPSKRYVLSSLDAARLHVSRDCALDNEKNDTANAAGDTSTLAGQLLVRRRRRGGRQANGHGRDAPARHRSVTE